jgi:glycosyltransferase involved in cell wall biosynthesis
VLCDPAPADAPKQSVDESGIAITSVASLARHSERLAEEIHAFNPDWLLVSSEDLSQRLLREAAHSAQQRIVYLAHTPQFFPFGPESWNPDTKASIIVQKAAGVVVIGAHMREYVRRHLDREAVVIHPPIYGTAPFPSFGSIRNRWVLMVNPCQVKGIGIFRDLAERHPQVPFAALAGWGTTSDDRRLLERVTNITILETVPHIDDVLRDTRILLMPSLWYEGFGLIAMEALVRGIPVVSSDSGGLVDAKRGTGYVVPVRPITSYRREFDESHMPVPEVPEQNISGWDQALARLLGDTEAYREESVKSRAAGEAFVRGLSASDFEDYLSALKPTPEAAANDPRWARLSPAQRALLVERLRHKGHK